MSHLGELQDGVGRTVDAFVGEVVASLMLKVETCMLVEILQHQGSDPFPSVVFENLRSGPQTKKNLHYAQWNMRLIL